MSNLTIEQYVAWLRKHSACAEAVAWCKSRADFAACYRKCQRPDWLLWLLVHAGVLDDKRARLFACWCVRYTPLADGRVVWDLLTNERSRMAVEVAERHAVGEATADELSTARSAARSAARDAGWDAELVAAWSATQDRRFRAAWYAASDAADAAWYAAEVSGDEHARSAQSVRSAAEIVQCDRIREVWTVGEVADAITKAMRGERTMITGEYNANGYMVSRDG